MLCRFLRHGRCPSPCLESPLSSRITPAQCRVALGSFMESLLMDNRNHQGLPSSLGSTPKPAAHPTLKLQLQGVSWASLGAEISSHFPGLFSLSRMECPSVQGADPCLLGSRGWGSQVSPGPVVILWVFGADGDFWPELPIYPTAVRNAGSHTEMQVLDVWGSLGLDSAACAADPSAG